MIERLRRDVGLACVLAALALAIALYAPTLGHGLINYDDPWLVRDNWIVQHPSWASLHAILLDTSRDTRFVLGAEYLPVRDLSIMLDAAIWGDSYAGFHLTNLIVYLASIVAWFAALEAFGIDRKLAGIAVLLWAIHPSHAESVAWLTERKGLLAALFAALATLGYARFRTGRGVRYLVLGVLAAVCAVWSKAPAAFALAAIGALELVLPGRASWRRSLVALAAIGVAGALALVPVVTVAADTAVIGTADHAPWGHLAMVLGLHGFYLRLGALAVQNAVSYPIATGGPALLDIALGVIGLAAAGAVAVVPARGRWRPPIALRAAAVLWLVNWLPISRLVLPLRAVLVADRYLLVPTLGLALAAAVGLARIARPRIRRVIAIAIVIAAAASTLDAQASWRDATMLWARAVASNPDDGNAWSMYAEALGEAGELQGAQRAVAEGLAHVRAPRLVMRQALIVLPHDRAQGMQLMREAAETEPRAMSNLALLLLDEGKLDEALGFAARGAAAMPLYAPAHRTLGKVALEAHHPDQAFAAFDRAYRLEPQNLGNRCNLALALIALHREPEARPHLEACARDPALGPRARAVLDQLPRPPARSDP